MANLFDDYENLLTRLSTGERTSTGQEGQPFTGSNPQQLRQQQQSINIPINNNQDANNDNSSYLSSSRFGSISSSHLGSESNYNDFNEALSTSLNSGILSPYSTGSSPDGFFLSATTSNADSQASVDEFELEMDPHGHPFSTNDVLYPPNLVPVPMGESMSNSTVTFNTQDQQHQVQQQPNFQPMNPVKEEDESPESRRSDYSDVNKLTGNNSSGSGTMGGGNRKVKSSHNLIEKKYRTNINSKIIELRNCVPALRILVAKNGNHRTRSTTNEIEDTDDYYEGNGYTDDEEKCDGLKPAKKLNKATILAKASEYIKHLEKKNDILRMENEHLKVILEQRSSPQAQHLAPNHNGQLYAQSMHSSPYNNSSSTGGNLLSPLNAEIQNQQLAYDHQTLNKKLMMGNINGFLGTNVENFSGNFP